MAKCNDKLEHRSAQEKFPPQVKLSAPNSDLQCTIEAANTCDSVEKTAVNPVPATRQRTPQPETDPAYLRALHWWRFRIALALYTGAFPNVMRLQPSSFRYVSYTELLQHYKTRLHHRRR